MRLTLRTLLAYLDDTLEPLEIKKIGQKVSESDTAQELIARIKQVTRRRRITTPPATGPNSFDPNMVADYLDNESSAEQIAELEKICLESDVHLAEVASCHQILTLVLGEPAAVPPTAKERMYALVQGREAIPFRKAAAAEGGAAASVSGDRDADETFLLGLPLYRRGSWLRWALPLVGVVLLAVVAVALWQSVRDVQPIQSERVANLNPSDKHDAKKLENGKDVAQPDKSVETQPDKSVETQPDKSVETQPDKNAEAKLEKNVETDEVARKKAPNTDRVEVGSYFIGPKSQPSILVQRKQDSQRKPDERTQDAWHRLTTPMRVSTLDQLVSLPGYASEVRLDSGVHLLLRGHVQEFSLFPDMNYLQESSVVLHKGGKGVDADVTLQCGRLYLSNHKDNGPVVIRLRFEKEVWDLTLKERSAEVVVDLLKRYRGDVDYLKDETPVATLHLFVLEGNASLAAEHQLFPALSKPSGPAYFVWNNKGVGAGLRGPIKQESIPVFFRPVLPVDPNKNPYADKMDQALKQVSLRMLADKDPVVVLKEVLQKTEDPMQHRLAIYCFGALDKISDLLDVIGDTDFIHAPDRETAIFTLRRWIGRDAENGRNLFNTKTETGILRQQKMYTTSEAERIFALLHDFSEEEIFAVETYDKLDRDLLSDKVAIAELARWHLYRLARIQGVSIPSIDKFNAAAPRDVREVAYREVKDKIEKGELPLRPSLPGKGNGGGVPGKGTQPLPKNPTRPGPGGGQIKTSGPNRTTDSILGLGVRP